MYAFLLVAMASTSTSLPDPDPFKMVMTTNKKTPKKGRLCTCDAIHGAFVNYDTPYACRGHCIKLDSGSRKVISCDCLAVLAEPIVVGPLDLSLEGSSPCTPLSSILFFPKKKASSK